MDVGLILFRFMGVANGDPRIGPSHVSLYVAIICCCLQQDAYSSITVNSKDLMKQAKISGLGTYYKCIRDLTEAGYIKYVPSFNPMIRSHIYVVEIKE